MKMRGRILHTALFLVAAQVTLIHASEPGAVARLHGDYLSGSAEVRGGMPGAASFSIDDGVGIDLGFGYRFSRRLGIGISGAVSDLDVDPHFPYPVSGTVAEDLRVVLLTVALEVHFTPGSRFDLYLAPSFEYLHFGDLEARPAGASWTARREIDDDSTWGVGLGFELPFGDTGWAFSSSLRYVDVKLFHAAGHTGGKADPMFVDADLPLSSIAVGIAYRF